MTDPARGAGGEVDASVYFEEILGNVVVRAERIALPEGPLKQVELVGQHLRLAGRIPLGRYRRVTDYVNLAEGLLHVRDAAVLRRNGDPTRVGMDDVWIAPHDVTLIAELEDEPPPGAAREFILPKAPAGLLVVTPGHTITGLVFTTPGADLSVFVESPEPRFMAMREVRTRSLADRRVTATYPFALLNRRHMVAVSPPPLEAVGTRGVI